MARLTSLLRRRAAALALALAGAAPLVPAAASESGLPVPRWVSIRASEVNLRTGPGTSYPVEWVYHRRRMPVEVVGEFESWRKIRDWQGTVGWVHQSMLEGSRMALVIGGQQTLRRDPEDGAAPVALLQEGVIAQLAGCDDAWCRLEIGSYEGWLKRDQFWGAYPDEEWR